MSRGIGARQSAILKTLEKDGPMVAVDLAVRMWESLHGPGGTVTYSFYESSRRATVTLVAKGTVLSGSPVDGPRGRECAKVVFWLPGQAPPDLKQKIPKALFEHGVLKALSGGPRSYSGVVQYVGEHLTKDRYEYERLRGSISLAVKRLVAAGKVRRYMGSDDLGKREMLSVGM